MISLILRLNIARKINPAITILAPGYTKGLKDSRRGKSYAILLIIVKLRVMAL